MYGSSKATTQEDYLKEIEEPKRSELQALDKLIRKNAPNLKPAMLAGMMAYGVYHYKSPRSKCEGEWFQVGMVANKTGISVYVCAVDEKGYLAEQAKDRLGKATVGKSCIRFKKLEDINLDVLAECVKKAAELPFAYEVG